MCLLREQTASLLVAIATRSDTGSHYRLDMIHKVLYQRTLSFEINESRLSDTRCLIQDVVTWYKVLYQHTMYVISLSNISIKTNFKQITRFKLKCVQYSEGDYISCMTSCYICRSFNDATLLCLSRLVVIQVRTTGSTWCKVLYHHTMYVVDIYLTFYEFSFEINEGSLSDTRRVELKFVQYSQGYYILCMTSRYFFRSFTNVRLLCCFVSHWWLWISGVNRSWY
jgi:hypothetical protein